MSSQADVVVVGAGPAGSTAARALALAGLKVLLLDRARFPRQKPCGGAISIRALSRFPHLTDALAAIPTHAVRRLHLESPGGETLALESPEPAVLLIRRVEFDRRLVELAAAAGAELVEGAAISQVGVDRDGVRLVARDGRRFRAGLVIGADGVHSVVARRTGLNPGWPRASLALDMMEETPATQLDAADPDSLWVSYGHEGSDGYAYVFPKHGHVNTGVGYVLSFFDAHAIERPVALQQRFVASLAAHGVLRGASSEAHFTPFLLPVAGPLRRTATERVLLAGDAGGFVNGFSAEGIYYAMVSGELAARAVTESGTRHAPRRYERLWRHEVGAELRDCVAVQRFLFRDRRRIDALVGGARRRPDLAGAVVDWAMGRQPYRQLRRRLLRSVPSLAWTLGRARFAWPGRRAMESAMHVTRTDR